jgi:hypothetical protein
MTRTLAILAIAAAALAGCKSDEKKDQPKPTPAPAAAPEGPLTYQDTINATLTAKVKAVDTASRLITLQNASGQQETFRVDPAVRRLAEVSPGDTVAISYRAKLLAELRPPTAAEAASPISYADISGRAPKTQDPAAVEGQTIRVVTTVEAVDAPNMLVTLRGPLGDVVLVKAKNPDNIKRIKRGDTIVITYTEAAAVALDKTP